MAGDSGKIGKPGVELGNREGPNRF